MELEFCRNELYRVKKGQGIREIAVAFGVPPRVLAKENGLTREAEEGQILQIPRLRRNLYTVRGGESKALLCGSDEAFEQRNRTKCLYPTQIVFL